MVKNCLLPVTVYGLRLPRLSPDERAGPAPARVVEEVGEEAESPPAAGQALVERPVDEHRAAEDEVAGDVAPEAAVEAVVAAVAHHEVVAFGDVEGLAVQSLARRADGVGAVEDVVRPLADGRGVLEPERRVVQRVRLREARAGVDADAAALGERLAVDEEAAPLV